jgi:hypothetical protein
MTVFLYHQRTTRPSLQTLPSWSMLATAVGHRQLETCAIVVPTRPCRRDEFCVQPVNKLRHLSATLLPILTPLPQVRARIDVDCDGRLRVASAQEMCRKSLGRWGFLGLIRTVSDTRKVR